MNNGYQQQSQVPKTGQTEQELRIASLLVKMHLKHYVHQVYCFRCRHHFTGSSYNYPTACSNCLLVFDDIGQYCLPDFILENNTNKGVIYVNGSIHDKNKQTRKDRMQIAELKAAGYKVFVIKNDEIDNMTNATLTAYLKSAYEAVASDSLYNAMYQNEKEYACLR